MEWVDGNLGSKLTMKYPVCVLVVKERKRYRRNGKGRSSTRCWFQMIHLARTSSTVVSKSMSRRGGKSYYRGWINFGKNCEGSRSNIECDTLILDEYSTSDTIHTTLLKILMFL